MKEYTKEEVSGLLDDYSKFIGCTTFVDFISRDYIEQFKKDKGLIPTIGWYKSTQSENSKWLGYYDGSRFVYGIDAFSRWIEMDSDTIEEDETLAANEEVEAALIAEAKKRGYKEGVTVFNSFTTSGCQYKIRSQSAYSFRNGTLRLGVVMLMCDGCWSTIVDTKLNDLEKKYKELGEEIERLKN